MYSTIDDRQLDQLVTEATAQHPAIGIRMVKGYMRGKGYRIQWKRVRESLLRTDPVGLAERCRITTRRRKYNVRYPLSLWHIDGNHKLIRYLLQILFCKFNFKKMRKVMNTILLSDQHSSETTSNTYTKINPENCYSSMFLKLVLSTDGE